MTTFSDLPYEVRYSIYEYLLADVRLEWMPHRRVEATAATRELEPEPKPELNSDAKSASTVSFLKKGRKPAVFQCQRGTAANILTAPTAVNRSLAIFAASHFFRKDPCLADVFSRHVCFMTPEVAQLDQLGKMGTLSTLLQYLPGAGYRFHLGPQDFLRRNQAMMLKNIFNSTYFPALREVLFSTAVTVHMFRGPTKSKSLFHDRDTIIAHHNDRHGSHNVNSQSQAVRDSLISSQRLATELLQVMRRRSPILSHMLSTEAPFDTVIEFHVYSWKRAYNGVLPVPSSAKSRHKDELYTARLNCCTMALEIWPLGQPLQVYHIPSFTPEG